LFLVLSQQDTVGGVISTLSSSAAGQTATGTGVAVPITIHAGTSMSWTLTRERSYGRLRRRWEENCGAVGARSRNPYGQIYKSVCIDCRVVRGPGASRERNHTRTGGSNQPSLPQRTPHPVVVRLTCNRLLHPDQQVMSRLFEIYRFSYPMI